ncbi:MAG: hypothetical protein ABJG68_01695 [Crocinitomicaceae bacterium]
MMKSIRTILLFCITLVLTSCFEIIEDVQVNQDGSGSLKYIVNFSQSSSKIKSLMLAGEVDGKKIPTEDELLKDFEKICNTTKKAKGISEVAYSSDFDNYIFTYSAKFTSLKNVNAAIDSVKSDRGEEQLGFEYFNFDASTKTFKRQGDDMIEKLRAKMTSSQQLIFTGATYTCLYRFYTEISNVKPVGASLSASKKNCFKKLYMSSFVWNGKLIDQEIHL